MHRYYVLCISFSSFLPFMIGASAATNTNTIRAHSSDLLFHA